MKNRNIGIFGAPFLVISMLIGLTACANPGAIEEKDTIYIEPYSRSGFGTDYIEDIFNSWKKETGSNFKLSIVNDSSLSGSGLVPLIRSGTDTSDIFLSGIPSFNQGFYDTEPILEDLTPLLNEKPEGKLTIKDKIIDFDSWKMSSSKLIWNEDDTVTTDSLFVLPFTRTFTGWIFDYGAFLEKGLLEIADYTDYDVINQLSLQKINYHTGTSSYYPGETVLIFDSCESANYCNYKQGDVITSFGKDGKFGTYDDGQPQTWDNFDDMIGKIQGTEHRPFVFSQNVQQCYLQELVEQIFTQEAGLDTYYALSSFNSHGNPIKMDDSTSEIITWKNGYKAYNSTYVRDNLKFALEKAEKYTILDEEHNYYYTSDVRAAQGKFILGGLEDEEFTGMLYDGNWFENQAKQDLINAGKKKAGRGYGEVDYRFMCLPNSENALGIDGLGNGTVFTAPETGGIAVRKQPEDNPEKKAAIFDFIKYLLKDTSLSKITRTNCLIMGYKYNITNEELNSTTPFIRNCYQLYQDTENVKCTPIATDLLSAPFSTLDDTGKFITEESSFLTYPLNGTECISAYNARAFSKVAISTICDNYKERYSEDTWNSIYNSMKNKLKAK